MCRIEFRLGPQPQDGLWVDVALAAAPAEASA